MCRRLSIVALIVVAAATSMTTARAQQVASAKLELRQEQDAFKRLYDLGYPMDTTVAVRRWRADTGSTGTGLLTAAEIAAILAQPDPEFFAAFAGNPFQGLGISVRHKTRSAAEAQAIDLCRRQGGGKTCDTVHVIPAGQCMFVSGYRLPRGDRRPHRGTFVIGFDLTAARTKSFDACNAGALARCRPILSFCADGSQMNRFDRT